jgi:hypothetical protein
MLLFNLFILLIWMQHVTGKTTHLHPNLPEFVLITGRKCHTQRCPALAVDGIAVAVPEIQQSFGDVHMAHQSSNMPGAFMDGYGHQGAGLKILTRAFF